MTSIHTYFRTVFLSLGIVLSALLSGCGGGGATTATATDGTTIAAGTPDVSFIYIATTASSNKKAGLTFNVSKKGTPLSKIGVTATLNAQALAAGVTFFGGATTLFLTTDDSGNTEKFYVVSGTIPTSVIVKGALSNNIAVADFSSPIAVSSGSADQNRFSLALSDLSIEGWRYLGTTTLAVVQLADRLGNPVPDGTSINFTVSPGVIVTPTTCQTSASTCSVTLSTSDAVGRTPFVTVLAYTQGEESFVDTNGNNTYDPGEPFTDLGKPYRDDNQNNAYDLGIDSSLNTIGTGTGICPTGDYSAKYSVPGTCNGVRDAAAIVRATVSLYIAPSDLALNLINTSSDSFTYELYSLLDGSSAKYRAPSGTTLSVTVLTRLLDTSSNCTASLDQVQINSNVNNALTPSRHILTYTKDLCIGRQAVITVTTPKGRSFNHSVNL